jgi:hypothetical protein
VGGAGGDPPLRLTIETRHSSGCKFASLDVGLAERTSAPGHNRPFGPQSVSPFSATGIDLFATIGYAKAHYGAM